MRRLARLLSDDQRVRAGRLERSIRSRIPGDLDALARHYGSDKSSEHHGYTRPYQTHFGKRRLRVRSVLEIGVGGVTSQSGYETAAGGQSLHMWSKYFPRARVLGVDIHHKSVSGPRITFEQGDQGDPEFLARIARNHGPFDIVIDDGSHIGRHIIASHKHLWEHVKPGGFYVIEDLALAYDARWEGGPPGTPGTAAALLKELVDSTLSREGQDFTPTVAGLHVYAGTAVIEKAG